MTWSLGEYCTLNDVKNDLHITSVNTAQDDILQDYIQEASSDIEQFTNRKFYARSETRFYHGFDNADYRTLLLDDDLLTVSGITIAEGTITVDVATEIDLLPNNFSPKNRIRLKNSTWKAWQNIVLDPTHSISVTGSWGYNAGTLPPKQIRRACIKLVSYRYHRTFAPFEEAGTGDVGEYGVSVDVPIDIQRILYPFQRKQLYATSSTSR